jgi:uncharacterized DUF497 family protein
MEMEIQELLGSCVGFQWDLGNSEKNWIKHNVTPFECEQIFFNQPLVAAEDPGHSQKEKRYFSLGKTDGGRMLYVVFTVRGHQIRVISARDMNRKERKVYNHL